MLTIRLDRRYRYLGETQTSIGGIDAYDVTVRDITNVGDLDGDVYVRCVHHVVGAHDIDGDGTRAILAPSAGFTDSRIAHAVSAEDWCTIPRAETAFVRSAYPVTAAGLAELLVGIAHFSIKAPTILATVALVLSGSITYTVPAPHTNAPRRVSVGPVWITDVEGAIACTPGTCPAILDKGIASLYGRAPVPQVRFTGAFFVAVWHAVAIDITSAGTLRACIEWSIDARALRVRCARDAQTTFTHLSLFLADLDIRYDATLAQA